jgi:hypothetical protein
MQELSPHIAQRHDPDSAQQSSGNTATNFLSPLALGIKKARSALFKPASYNSLLSLTNQTYSKVKEKHADLLKKAKNGQLTDGEKEELKKALFKIAYGNYSSVLNPGNVMSQFNYRAVNKAQQLELVREVIGIESGGRCRVFFQGQAETGNGTQPWRNAVSLQPDAEPDENALETLRKSHLHITRPAGGAINMRDGEGRYARISLTLKPDRIASAASKMTDLFENEAGRETVYTYKVTQANRAGERADSIVIYLNKADYQNAKAIRDFLLKEINNSDWVPSAPMGMHEMRHGISYAEFNSNSSSSSFGKDRCDLVVDSIIHYITEGKAAKRSLEGEMKTMLANRGYSKENPALLADPDTDAT